MASTQHRIANIERLRIVAAFGIVWFHTEGAVGRSIGLAGLPIFLLIFCALISLKTKLEDIVPFSRRRARRLLKPWLFWSIIYLGTKLLKLLLYNMHFTDTFAFYMLFTGPSIHLWYLPYAFVAALVLNLLHRCTIRISYMVTILFATVIGSVLLFACSVTISSVQIPFPLLQCVFGLPVIPLGFAIGLVYSSQHGRIKQMSYFGIIVATGIVCLLLTYVDYSHLVIPYGIAIVLVCTVFLWEGKLHPLTQKYASLSYGIYLVHPLIGSILNRFVIANTNPWFMMIVVFLVSSLVTLILQKTRLGQFI